MKRSILVSGLLLALSISTFAGWTSNTGYAGCTPGVYWFNDETGEGFCCPPGIECPLGRSTYEPPTKKTDSIFEFIFLNFARVEKIIFLRP